MFIVVGLIALIVVSGGYLMLSQQSTENDKNTAATVSSMQNKNEESQTKMTVDSPSTTTSTTGSYETYTDEGVAAVKGTKILFFHAPWCPQCRALEESIQSGTVPENVTIFKVDYDTNTKLRQQYGVTIQTTLVRIDNLGNEQQKFVAYDRPTLETVIQELL